MPTNQEIVKQYFSVFYLILKRRFFILPQQNQNTSSETPIVPRISHTTFFFQTNR